MTFDDIKPLYSQGTVLWDREMRKHHPLVLDIGANEGGFAVVMAASAHEVHAFEPVPDKFADLRAVAACTPNMEAYNLGMSDVPGRVENVSVFNTWTLLPVGTEGEDRAVEYAGQKGFDVELITVDDHCAEHGDPGFIKLDVDGYEMRVLRGAVNTLSRTKCSVLFEYSYLAQKFFGEPIGEMERFIYDMGYRACSLDGEYVAPSAEDMMKCYPAHTSYDLFLIHQDNL